MVVWNRSHFWFEYSWQENCYSLYGSRRLKEIEIIDEIFESRPLAASLQQQHPLSRACNNRSSAVFDSILLIRYTDALAMLVTSYTYCGLCYGLTSHLIVITDDVQVYLHQTSTNRFRHVARRGATAACSHVHALGRRLTCRLLKFGNCWKIQVKIIDRFVVGNGK